MAEQYYELSDPDQLAEARSDQHSIANWKAFAEGLPIETAATDRINKLISTAASHGLWADRDDGTFRNPDTGEAVTVSFHHSFYRMAEIEPVFVPVDN